MILIYNQKRYYSDSNGYWMRQYQGNGKIIQKYLHREVWEEHYGPIPPGYIVHHKDENKLNYSIENLEMMHRSTHIRLHRQFDGDKRNQKLRETIRKRPPQKCTCCHCGLDFFTKSRKARHCSIYCWRERRALLSQEGCSQLVLSF